MEVLFNLVNDFDTGDPFQTQTSDFEDLDASNVLFLISSIINPEQHLIGPLDQINVVPNFLYLKK